MIVSKEGNTFFVSKNPMFDSHLSEDMANKALRKSEGGQDLSVYHIPT